MPVSVVAKPADKIRRIVEEQRLEIERLEPALRRLDRQIERQEFVPHSFHANGVDLRSGRQVHLRVLVWRSASWQRLRTETIAHHRAAHRWTTKRALAFGVPAVVRSGEAPLLWDLTERVDAKNLPWDLRKTNLMAKGHSRHAQTMVDIAHQLARARLRNVYRWNWPAFHRQFESMVAWSVRTDILHSDDAREIRAIGRDFRDHHLARNRATLSHGDYNPSNVLFGRGGSAWLIDFDHLRYSVIGDPLGRLATISFNEPAWSDSIVRRCRQELDESEWNGFLVFGAWHVFNRWQGIFRLHAPRRGVGSLAEIEEMTPANAREIRTQRRRLMPFLLD